MVQEKQIWFTKEQHTTIKIEAAKRGMSMRDYIDMLIREVDDVKA